MNIDDIATLREPLRELMANASRENEKKPQRYWYPLSIATYDVEEVLGALDSLCSFRTSMWEKTRAFEEGFAAWHDLKEGVMVNSGSSADLLIAFALVNERAGLLAPGAKVLVPSVTWPTQIWALMMAGLRPVFVDTDPETLNMSVADMETKGKDAEAIFVTHLMGNPCDMKAVMKVQQEQGLLLVEDCCEALGARFDEQLVGTFGVASAFSFFFSHHITTMEGGMVCCEDPTLSDVFRLLRAHGWARDTKYLQLPAVDDLDPRYTFLDWGFNVRPTDLQAAFGLEQLTRLGAFDAQRRENAAYLQAALKPFDEVVKPMEVHPAAQCSWFAFPVMVTPDAPFKRRDLTTYLEAQGIETRPVVAGSLLRHPVADSMSELPKNEFPGADAVHERGFYIGIHPVDEGTKLERVQDTFARFMRSFATG